ncbi:hypothetical protein ROE7235_03748 [Roseibaca ekhonensis]|uniref:Uncharacterized protein n=1 Tax=Roseinatronobacter ekhonensis TaxID=254356 RepID=A0A3B0MSF1_9RHOB|nr:hypothetical protein ROE7235_03748 [Roseibaca ekhonensis]
MVHAADEIAEIQTGDTDPGQAAVQRFQVRLERGQVEPARALARQAEGAARDLAAEADLLQIQKPRRALQICQRLGVDRDKALEICLRRDLEAQQVEEGDIVFLKDTEQVVHLARAVVDEFSART